MADMERWDDYLIAEHELIERGMAVLKNCLERLDDTLKNPIQLKRAIDFLLEFGDKIHNKKEEDFLFPLLEKRGIPGSPGPLGVMLQEHDAERQLLARMVEEISDLNQRPQEVLRKFKQEGLEYLSIRAEHIWKENDVLYPMGRKVLEEQDNPELMTEFHRIDQETYGPDARALYARMVDEVEQGADIEKQIIRGLSYDQIDAIMETLPFEVTFVDASDSVAYFNRLDKSKIFPRTRSVIGRKVEKCHPAKSVDRVSDIVRSFKDGTRDKAEFWIDFRGDKVLIRYFPVYDRKGEYMGVLEVTQGIGEIQEIIGEKRL